MNARVLLVALLVVSTAAFAVGVSIERSSGDTHSETPAVDESSSATGESGEEAEGHAEGGAGAQAHVDEGGGAGEESNSETLLGIDLEAAPFVALAAAFSLALAVAVWLRPTRALLLAGVVVAMVAFAALDVREVFHQLDESKTGLAVLAVTVAALHLGAALVAARLRGEATPAG